MIFCVLHLTCKNDFRGYLLWANFNRIMVKKTAIFIFNYIYYFIFHDYYYSGMIVNLVGLTT